MKKATLKGSFEIEQWVLQSKANYSTFKPLKNSNLSNQHTLIRSVLYFGHSITVEWARKHGIDYLPARISELKAKGVSIGTVYATDHDENGTKHKRRAFYYLDKPTPDNNQQSFSF